MDIITIEGEALYALRDALDDTRGGRMPVRLRVAFDVDGVKFKIDEGIWSPPYPVAAEDVRRRAAQPRERGWQIGDGNTQVNHFGDAR